MENITQYEIQEQILKKLDGLSTDQLSYLSVLVDQIKDSNSTLVSIKEGLDGATIYKDKIVYMPKEVVKYVEKEVVIDDKLRVENERLKKEVRDLNKRVCPTLVWHNGCGAPSRPNSYRASAEAYSPKNLVRSSRC